MIHGWGTYTIGLTIRHNNLCNYEPAQTNDLTLPQYSSFVVEGVLYCRRICISSLIEMPTRISVGPKRARRSCVYRMVSQGHLVLHWASPVVKELANTLSHLPSSFDNRGPVSVRGYLSILFQTRLGPDSLRERRWSRSTQRTEDCNDQASIRQNDCIFV